MYRHNRSSRQKFVFANNLATTFCAAMSSLRTPRWMRGIDFQSSAMTVPPGLYHCECSLYWIRKKGKSFGIVVGPPSLMHHTCRLTFQGL